MFVCFEFEQKGFEGEQKAKQTRIERKTIGCDNLAFSPRKQQRMDFDWDGIVECHGDAVAVCACAWRCLAGKLMIVSTKQNMQFHATMDFQFEEMICMRICVIGIEEPEKVS